MPFGEMDGQTERWMMNGQTDGQMDGWVGVRVEALHRLENTSAALLENPLKETLQSSCDKVSITFIDYFSIKPM